MSTAVASPISISLSSLRVMWIAMGMIAAVKINVIGEIYIGEVLALVALPFLLLKRRVDRNIAFVIGLAVFWSAGQFISDLINQTDRNLSVKGVMAPLVFAATIGSTMILFDRYPKRMPSLLLGVALTLFVDVIFTPTPEQIFEPWKWGYGVATLGVGLVWLSFFRARSLLLMSLAVLAFFVACILASARSLAMIPLAGFAAYVFWHTDIARSFKRWLTGRFGPLKIAALVIAVTWALNTGLTAFFSSGVLDPFLEPTVSAKYKQQASADVGLLLAGRSESLISIQAYLDAPIVGHGSWAQDKSGYISRYTALLYKLGISDNLNNDDATDLALIPAHSYLFGALVWSGLAGGIFWIAFTFRVIKRYLKFATRLPLYFHVGLVNLLWNLFFSPFGADARWAVAVFIAALFACCNQLGRTTTQSPAA